MKNTLAITAVIFTFAFVTLPVVWGDDDFHWGEIEEYKHRSNDVTAVTNPAYKEECGSCHLAYPPGLLPARSWRKVMLELESHFGDNAELDAETHQSITEFLLTNSADKSEYRRSKKFSRSINYNDAPVRISETPYFKHEHDEIPARLVQLIRRLIVSVNAMPVTQKQSRAHLMNTMYASRVMAAGMIDQ